MLCGNLGLFCNNTGSALEWECGVFCGSFVRKIGLFCGNVRLFCVLFLQQTHCLAFVFSFLFHSRSLTHTHKHIRMALSHSHSHDS